jgi:hypothetical protein
MDLNRPAVFARNHRHYLEEAAAVAETDPSQLITFRSAGHWTTAEKALATNNTIPIYFAVIREGENIAFEADLVSVYVNPEPQGPETERMLNFSLPSTADEGLWEAYDSPVRTLYMIKRCRELSQPFPMTNLVKLSNDEPIAPNFGYSYSIVYQRGSEPDVRSFLPGEISDPGRYWEGATRLVSVVTYERSNSAREACLRHHGYDCAVCGFNFEATYGELGEGFIHVHHLVSLSDIDGAYEIDPINDLIPLCPNCHAMAHRSDETLDLAELRELMRQAAG